MPEMRTKIRENTKRRQLVDILIILAIFTGMIVSASGALIEPDNATSSSRYSSDYLAEYASNGIVGLDQKEIWYGDGQKSFPKWIKFSFNETYDINRIDFATNEDDGPQEMILQGSNDNTAWNNLKNVTYNSASERWENYSITRAFQYYRVYITSSGRQYGSASEVRFWGNANSPPKIDSTNISPNTPVLEDPVSYNASGSDIDGTVEYFKLSLSGGCSKKDVRRSGRSVSWNDICTVQSGGWLNASIKAVDDRGGRITTQVNKRINGTKIIWNDDSNNEDGFNIYSNKSGSYEKIESTGPNKESFVDLNNGLNEDDTCYRITAFNSFGESAPLEGCV